TNATGDGSYSGSATQVTGSSGLGAPGTPTFSSVTSSGMRVSWSTVSGATSYSVERCTGAGCSSFTVIVANTSNTFYDDSALNAGTSYTYQIRAANAGGVGPYSGSGTQVTSAAGSASGVDITGWLWSDTIGWIATSCKNGGSTGNDICATYSF